MNNVQKQETRGYKLSRLASPIGLLWPFHRCRPLLYPQTVSNPLYHPLSTRDNRFQGTRRPLPILSNPFSPRQTRAAALCTAQPTMFVFIRFTKPYP